MNILKSGRSGLAVAWIILLVISGITMMSVGRAGPIQGRGPVALILAPFVLFFLVHVLLMRAEWVARAAHPGSGRIGVAVAGIVGTLFLLLLLATAVIFLGPSSS